MTEKLTPKPSIPLTADQKIRAISKLEKRLIDLEQFDPRIQLRNSPAVTSLEVSLGDTFDKIFGIGTAERERYAEISTLDKGGWAYMGTVSLEETRNFLRMGQQEAIATITGLIKSFKEDIEDEGKFISSPVSPTHQACIENIKLICQKFHLVATQLAKRHSNRVTLEVNDEYDVQDLMHSLLRIYFKDIRDEEWTPSYAGGASRVDFLLKEIKTVVEIKKTRANLKGRELGEELLIDIHRYRAHPDCKNLICFVYDPKGYIQNPSGMEHDLTGTENDFFYETIIIPKGF